MPDYTDQDVTDVVLCLRDWGITRLSQQAHGYLSEQRERRDLTEPTAIRAAILKQIEGRRLHLASYEGLCGPFGDLVLRHLLQSIGLDVERYPIVKAEDGNRKYLKLPVP